MISSRAKAGFDKMVMQGLKAALAPSPDEVTELVTLPELRQPPESHAALLSIASLTFRMLIVLHFSHNDATRRHFARLSRQKAEEMSEQSFLDAICEAGNLCCGGVNRDLGSVFPWVGMSTPNIVDSRCTAHLGVLKYGHLQHFRLSVTDSPPLFLTLCVSESEDLDFDFQIPDLAEQGTGELEMF
ncbi:hypothetical protein [Curvibacter gracilis]|uniref:hypothetical protein n=1 Tax=Curvibacter gracilis TaxID=230310 RepID=UPI000486638F|nr:hypothetical protein [Curvibacter gracilis]